MKKVLKELGIHPSWNEELIPLFQDKRMNVILKVLDKCDFTPSKKIMFKVFSMPIQEIRVVIIGESPYSSKNKATGLAFAGQSSTLNIILNTIEREYYKEDFDTARLDQSYDLLHWHNKGIFLLNVSLSTQVGISNAHYKYWKWFTEKIVEIIQKYHSGLIWMLWGDLSHNLNIDENQHYVLREELPEDWTTNPFLNCNQILTSNNGESLF